MKSYIEKPRVIESKGLESRGWSFSSTIYNIVKNIYKNTYKLEEILKYQDKGVEFGSENYVDFGNNYFIRISNLTSNNFSFFINKDILKIKPTKTNKKIKKYDICYQTASDVGNVCIYLDNQEVFFNSHIRKLEFLEEYDKFYIFALLKSNYAKEQVITIGSIKGTDNFTEDKLLNVRIPFPTTKNNSNPHDIEKLISLITQNIIDKEEQIKFKNEKINNLIEEELKNNQKDNVFEYKYPNRDEVFNEGRLDTGVYSETYKEIEFLIENYKGGFNKFKNFIFKYSSGITPLFFEINNKSLPLFIRPTEINKNRTLKEKRYISTNKYEKINIENQEGLILPRKGSINSVYNEKNQKIIINDSLKFATINENINVKFLYCYFSSNRNKFLLDRIKQKTNGGSLTEENLNNIKIPNFPPQKQEEIAKEYYNTIEKNINLNLENYLELEKARNSKLGIFQLNMEIFELKDKLEELIDKVINEEEMEVNCEY